MHEVTMANKIVDKIMETALNKRAKKVLAVEILIGELNLLGEEQLTFWLNELLRSKGKIAKDAKIDLKLVESIIKCRQCGYEGNLKAMNEDHHNPIFKCPSCNLADIEIKRGRECILNKVELEI